MNLRTHALLWSLLLAGTGCADDGDGGVEPLEDDVALDQGVSALSAGCTELGETINNHACQHGSLGPFGSVTASANPSFTTTNQRLDAIHKYFTVTLPAASPGFAGTVKFTPAASDDFAFYVHPSVSLSVRNKNGVAVAPLLTGSVAGCSYLTSYKIYALSTSLAPYKVDLSATSSSVKALVEQVTPMVERWYQDVDGDTFGAASPSFVTACTPPAGYDVKVGGDCDNTSASVYPGAPETAADGVDSNCNGSDDT